MSSYSAEREEEGEDVYVGGKARKTRRHAAQPRRNPYAREAQANANVEAPRATSRARGIISGVGGVAGAVAGIAASTVSTTFKYLVPWMKSWISSSGTTSEPASEGGDVPADRGSPDVDVVQANQDTSRRAVVDEEMAMAGGRARKGLAEDEVVSSPQLAEGKGGAPGAERTTPPGRREPYFQPRDAPAWGGEEARRDTQAGGAPLAPQVAREGDGHPPVYADGLARVPSPPGMAPRNVGNFPAGDRPGGWTRRGGWGGDADGPEGPSSARYGAGGANVFGGPQGPYAPSPLRGVHTPVSAAGGRRFGGYGVTSPSWGGPDAGGPSWAYAASPLQMRGGFGGAAAQAPAWQGDGNGFLTPPQAGGRPSDYFYPQTEPVRVGGLGARVPFGREGDAWRGHPAGAVAPTAATPVYGSSVRTPHSRAGQRFLQARTVYSRPHRALVEATPSPAPERDAGEGAEAAMGGMGGAGAGAGARWSPMRTPLTTGLLGRKRPLVSQFTPGVLPKGGLLADEGDKRDGAALDAARVPQDKYQRVGAARDADVGRGGEARVGITSASSAVTTETARRILAALDQMSSPLSSPVAPSSGAGVPVSSSALPSGRSAAPPPAVAAKISFAAIDDRVNQRAGTVTPRVGKEKQASEPASRGLPGAGASMFGAPATKAPAATTPAPLFGSGAAPPAGAAVKPMDVTAPSVGGFAPGASASAASKTPASEKAPPPSSAASKKVDATSIPLPPSPEGSPAASPKPSGATFPSKADVSLPPPASASKGATDAAPFGAASSTFEFRPPQAGAPSSSSFTFGAPASTAQAKAGGDDKKTGAAGAGAGASQTWPPAPTPASTPSVAPMFAFGAPTGGAAPPPAWGTTQQKPGGKPGKGGEKKVEVVDLDELEEGEDRSGTEPRRKQRRDDGAVADRGAAAAPFTFGKGPAAPAPSNGPAPASTSSLFGPSKGAAGDEAKKSQLSPAPSLFSFGQPSSGAESTPSFSLGAKSTATKADGTKDEPPKAPGGAPAPLFSFGAPPAVASGTAGGPGGKAGDAGAPAGKALDWATPAAVPQTFQFAAPAPVFGGDAGATQAIVAAAQELKDKVPPATFTFGSKSSNADQPSGAPAPLFSFGAGPTTTASLPRFPTPSASEPASMARPASTLFNAGSTTSAPSVLAPVTNSTSSTAPGGGKDALAPPPSAPLFGSAGSGTGVSSTSTPSSGGFTFGAPPASASQPAFGSGASAGGSSAPGMFTFGAPPPSSTTPSSSAPALSSSSAAAAKPLSEPFPSTKPPTGAPPKTDGAPTPTFLFGAPPPSSSSSLAPAITGSSPGTPSTTPISQAQAAFAAAPPPASGLLDFLAKSTAAGSGSVTTAPGSTAATGTAGSNAAAPSSGFTFGAPSSGAGVAWGSASAPASHSGTVGAGETAPAKAGAGAGNAAAPSTGGFTFGAASPFPAFGSGIPSSSASTGASITFGSSASSGASLFGAPAPATPANPFGGSMSLFGAPATPANEAAPAVPSTGAPSSATPPFLFGASSSASTPAFGSTASTAAFGASTASTPAFGASTQALTFGVGAAPPASASSGAPAAPSMFTFGATPASSTATPAPFKFGAQPSAPAPSTGANGPLFGSGAGAPGSLFGGPPPSSSPSLGFTFGAAAPSQPPLFSGAAAVSPGGSQQMSDSMMDANGQPLEAPSPSPFGGVPSTSGLGMPPASPFPAFGSTPAAAPSQPPGGMFTFGASMPSPAPAPAFGGFGGGGSVPTFGAPAPAAPTPSPFGMPAPGGFGGAPAGGMVFSAGAGMSLGTNTPPPGGAAGARGPVRKAKRPGAGNVKR
eukprot:jgi/Mesvir1/17448/Mv08724-RA.1